MQIREATEMFTASDILDRPARMPRGAVLVDFRVGPGHEGHPSESLNVASFHYEGIVYYASIYEVKGKTKLAWST